MLRFGSEDFQHLSPADQGTVRRAMTRLTSRYGYCEHCIKDAIIFVLKGERG